MKNNKGITIISLLIYIIVLSIVIGTISILMKYFYQNTDETVISDNPYEQYSRFITYVSNDVNMENIMGFANTENEIVFDFKDGKTSHTYTYEGEKIYYKVVQDGNDKKIELCNGVKKCNFQSIDKMIFITIEIGDNEYKNIFVTNAINEKDLSPQA